MLKIQNYKELKKEFCLETLGFPFTDNFIIQM